MFASLRRALQSARQRSAARKYARLLGHRLLRDYGASARYTPGQIRTAAAACHLPPGYLSFGYAAFLSEAEFQTIATGADYHSLRALLSRHGPSGSGQTFQPAPENSDAFAGYIGSDSNW